MHLDIDEGFAMLKKANEKQVDSALWDMWLAKYPWMTEKDFVNFNDFKKQIIGDINKPRQKARTKEEIYAQADRILEAFNKSKGGKI